MRSVFMTICLVCMIIGGVIATVTTWGKPYTPMLFTYVPWYGWVFYAVGAAAWLGFIYTHKR